MSGNMLSLCDLTGNMARPWAEAGYDCWCVDIQHSIRRDRVERVGAGSIRYVWGDLRSWCPPEGVRFAFAAAFPPCTNVAGSGARDWQRKGNFMLTDALELFASAQMVLAYAACPYLIENPVGALSRHMRAPDHKFDPCDYAGYADDPGAEAYTKRTHLWTGNGFIMPRPRPVVPVLGSKIIKIAPGADRANERSATPNGFARAVFLANAAPAVAMGAAA